jgi:organic radical activating enzyme
MSNNIKDTICVFAWDYPVLNLSRNELRYCCRARPQTLSNDDFKLGTALFNNFIPIKQVRKDLLTGVKNADCDSCWSIEASGGKGPRSRFDIFVNFVIKNQVWPELSKEQVIEKLHSLTNEEIETLVNLESVRMIEISLGNTCDLKCMYCNHHYSSQWATESLKYGEIHIQDVERELPRIKDTIYEDLWWAWFDKSAGSNASTINFIGGEPLIIDKFYSYSDRIIDFYENNLTNNSWRDISIVTNFNTPVKLYNKFLTTVKKITASKQLKLDFNVSCEAIDGRAEFIRTGTDWALMVNNIDKFLAFINENDPSQSRIIFNFQIALNALCISDLPNFFKFVIKLQKDTGRRIHLRPNQIAYPEWLNPYILPPSYAKYIDESIAIIEEETKIINDHSKYSPFGRWEAYVSFLKTIKQGIENPNKNNNAKKEFVINIDKLASRRNLNFNKTFPEMIEFYNECKLLSITK